MARQPTVGALGRGWDVDRTSESETLSAELRHYPLILQNFALERRQVLERAKGIEPSYAAWEAAVLPLNYARAPASLSRSGLPLVKAKPCAETAAVITDRSRL